MDPYRTSLPEGWSGRKVSEQDSEQELVLCCYTRTLKQICLTPLQSTDQRLKTLILKILHEHCWAYNPQSPKAQPPKSSGSSKATPPPHPSPLKPKSSASNQPLSGAIKRLGEIATLVAARSHTKSPNQACLGTCRREQDIPERPGLMVEVLQDSGRISILWDIIGLYVVSAV